MSEEHEATGRLQAAVEEYIGRRYVRDRRPAGERDGADRWYPLPSEQRGCCSAIRAPSRRFPNSLLAHCYTARHVASLFGVSEVELRRAVRTALRAAS